MDLTLDANYWDNRYQENTSRWDLGKVSPPIKAYVDSLTDKSLKILIPGAGNSWEAEYLHQKGFTNVFVVDLAPTPLQNLKKRVPNFPGSHLFQKDFFDLEIKVDLILEQTFFCAINPVLRSKYVEKVHNLLVGNGKIAGLFFDAPLNDDKPPFGGSKKEYETLFSKHFTIQKMENCQISDESRIGRELFFEMIKKSEN